MHILSLRLRVKPWTKQTSYEVNHNIMNVGQKDR